MILIIVGSLVTAVFLVAQGIYVLRTGVVAWFFMPQHASGRFSGWRCRIGHASPYLLAGVGILALLMTAAMRRHLTLSSVTDWVADRLSLLVLLCIIISFGVCALFWPAIPIKWAQTAHPQLSKEDGVALLAARITGAGLLLISAVVLAHLQ